MMVTRFVILLFLFSYLYPMSKDISPMSPQEYRGWFKSATDREIKEYIIKPLLNRPLKPAEQYVAMLARKTQEWNAQDAVRLQNAEWNRFKNYSVVAIVAIGWCYIAARLFQERITEIMGTYL